MRESTEKMRRAVKYCENWCRVRFTGNIENLYEVRAFLDTYLPKAKVEGFNAIHGTCEIDYPYDEYASISIGMNGITEDIL